MSRLIARRGRTIEAPNRRAVSAVPTGTERGARTGQDERDDGIALRGLDRDPQPMGGRPEGLVELPAGRRVRRRHHERQRREVT